MANNINWGEVYKNSWFGNTINNISWGKIYADLASNVSVFIQSILDSLVGRGTIVENIEGTTTELVDLEDSGLLEKASILITPTSVSPSLIHAAIPINGDVDLDFVRATTATRVNELGLIEVVGANVPRLDFTDPLNPSNLVEPQRTNLISNSDDLTATSWGNLNSSSSLVFVENPKGEIGSSEYSLFNYTGSSQYFRINPNATYDSGVEYTYSIFVKYSSFQFLKISYINFSTGDFTAVFDIINGVVTATNTNGSATNTSASITEYRDGWFRISITASLTSSAGDAMNFEVNKSPSGTPTFNVFGRINQTTTTGDKVYVWGAQLEKVSYPTSIIPTDGAPVSRAADIINKTGISPYLNQNSGCLYFDVTPLPIIGTGAGFTTSISISDNSFINRVVVFWNLTGLNQLTIRYFSSEVGNFETFIDVPDITDDTKLAVTWAQNDFRIYINGVKVYENTTLNVTTVNTFNRIGLDGGTGSDEFNGEVRSLQVYPTVLTTPELIVLTGTLGINFYNTFLDMSTDLNYTI